MSTTTVNLPKMLSPPQVAARLGISPEKIIGWIRRGELRAIDVSLTPGVGRPRFRVDPTDLATFLNQRAVTAAPKIRRQRRQPTDIIAYF